MEKIVFSSLICALLVTAVTVTADDGLQCYQCNPVTSECADNKVDVVKCGHMAMCSRQVKKDSADKSRAVRKCVIPDKVGNVNCPNGYDCFNCAQNLCNANPVVTTTPAPGSASFMKLAWVTLIPVAFAGICF